jgi:transmembrane protein EpsG
MPFVFMAVKYTLDRNFKMYVLSVLLAYSFHTTSLVIFPLYYLYGLSYSKKNVIFLILIMVVGCSSLVTLGGYLSSYFPMYEHYLEIDAGGAAWSRALMKIYILAVYVFTLGKKSFDENMNKIVLISMIMCVIICVGAANIYGVYRLRDYYALADFVGVAIILKEARKIKGIKRTGIILMTYIYIALLAYSFNSFVTSANMRNDYQLFWKGQPHERESVI